MQRGQAHLPDLKMFPAPYLSRVLSGREGGLAPAAFSWSYLLLSGKDRPYRPFVRHSYRSAIIGSTFAARLAGR
jgi:hypothetical protein